MSMALEDELAWERRARQLLQSIALAAAESGSWHDTMQHAVREICLATGWPVGHALVRGDNGDLGSSRIWHLEDEERFHVLREVTEATRFPAGRGLPGRVLMTGRPLWIGDVTLDDNFPRAALAGDLGVRAAFALPVLVKDEVYAVLEFFSPLAAEPQGPLLDVMAAIGAQLGRVVERGLADEALRQSELRFRSVAQTAHDAIISADATGRIISWNRGASVMFGYTEDEALGRPLTMVIPERLRARHEEGLRRVGSGGAQRVIGRTVELEGLRRDGGEFPLELSLAAWQIGGASYYTGILRDITERKENEQRLHTVATRLERSEKAAIEANRAKSIFLANMSHELRTPLNAILGFVQLLRRDRTLNVGQREHVDVIARSGEHLLGLINDVLTISKIEAGETTLHHTHFDPGRLLRGLRELFHLRAEARGLELRFEISAAFPSLVTGDEGKLRQVLINVLGNAVKFTSRGRVDFRLSYAREMALFEIEDTGPGIASDELETIFEPFARGATAASGPTSGTGLGLTISKMLTDLMGGEMTVSSKPGLGTVFRIRLFLPEMRAALAERELPRTNRIGYSGERRRVLVVDNEEVDRTLLVSRLEPLGFDVAQAASGEECLAWLAHFKPDAILMDLAMPGIDGWQTIRTIREQRLGDAAIAIVSANAFDKGLDNDVGIANADFILKPVRVAELLDWLGRRLDLEWIESPRPAAAPPPDASVHLALPSELRLRALDELVNLGYFRGIVRMLDEIESEEAQCAAFVAHMRALAREFQLEAMTGVLKNALHAS